MSATTLSDKARASFAGVFALHDGSARARITAERAFMLGALSALELILQEDRTPRELLAECVQYGRTIGSAVEEAT